MDVARNTSVYVKKHYVQDASHHVDLAIHWWHYRMPETAARFSNANVMQTFVLYTKEMKHVKFNPDTD